MNRKKTIEMKNSIDPTIEEVLQCPNCCAGLTYFSKDAFACTECAEVFPREKTGRIDFRLKKPKEISIRFRIPCHDSFNDIPWSDNLPKKEKPQVDFRSTSIPHHLTKELLSYFPKAEKQTSMMLDLGCGAGVHRKVCESAGFNYVGIDYNNSKAPFLADAHALPFKDNCFEFLLSITVLEHLQFPFIAVQEAYRVLQPGGLFIGSVAFLEPFHENSYYHHSRLGTLNTLRYGGFEIVELAASTSWSVFAAQARLSHNNFFPKIPRLLSRNLILLPQRISQIWLRIGRKFKDKVFETSHADHISGAFYFVVRKPYSREGQRGKGGEKNKL